MLAALCAGTQFAQAQAPRQAIIANGNVFTPGNEATIGAYDLINNTYTQFDAIGARSVQDVIIDGASAYVAADSTIIHYNIDTYQRVATTNLPGVRKLALWNGNLIATVGYGGSGDYVRAFDATTLLPEFSITGISGDCEGLAIIGDSAYVAVNGGFLSTVGKMAVIDLATTTLRTEVNYDTLGKAIDRVYAVNGKIWSVSPIGFMNPYSVFTEFDPTSLNFTHHRVELITSSTIGIHNGLIYARRENGVFSFSLTSVQVVDSLLFPGTWAAGVIDTQRDEFLLTETDYFTYGTLSRFAAAGTLIDTAHTDASPEALALDYRLPASTQDQLQTLHLNLWPNPATDAVSFRLDQPIRNASLRLIDGTGRVLSQTTYTTLLTETVPSPSGEGQGGAYHLDISELPSGIYYVSIVGNGKQQLGKFVK